MLVNIFGDFGCFDYSEVLFFGLSKVVIFHAFGCCIPFVLL